MFEVLSPTDRLKDVLEKVNEYLAAGVLTVVAVDPDRESMVVHRSAQAPAMLVAGQSFTLPDLLVGFKSPVDRLFPTS